VPPLHGIHGQPTRTWSLQADCRALSAAGRLERHLHVAGLKRPFLSHVRSCSPASRPSDRLSCGTGQTPGADCAARARRHAHATHPATSRGRVWRTVHRPCGASSGQRPAPPIRRAWRRWSAPPLRPQRALQALTRQQPCRHQAWINTASSIESATGALAHAADLLVFPVLQELHQRYRVQDDRHDVILRYPVLPVRRQQEGLTAPGPADIWGNASSRCGPPSGNTRPSKARGRHSLHYRHIPKVD
jgi:hypothetical protein